MEYETWIFLKKENRWVKSIFQHNMFYIPARVLICILYFPCVFLFIFCIFIMYFGFVFCIFTLYFGWMVTLWIFTRHSFESMLLKPMVLCNDQTIIIRRMSDYDDNENAFELDKNWEAHMVSADCPAMWFVLSVYK